MTEITKLLNENEVARMLGLSVRTLQMKRVTGGGPRFIKLGRTVRYRLSDIEAFITAGARATTSEAA